MASQAGLSYDMESCIEYAKSRGGEVICTLHSPAPIPPLAPRLSPSFISFIPHSSFLLTPL